MKPKKKAFLFSSIMFLILPFLSSCSKNPSLLFRSFERYKSDDGLLTLECQLSNDCGFGTIRLEEKIETIEWSELKNGHALYLAVGDNTGIRLSISSIKVGFGKYSDEKVSAKVDDIDGEDERLLAFANWSSNIYKERELTDEEIDARRFDWTLFTNDELGFYFGFSEIGKFKSKEYLLTLNEDKSFLIEAYEKPGKSTGKYSNTKTCLYLSFEEDDFFDSKGKTLPFVAS